jgi:hypothetical protein
MQYPFTTSSDKKLMVCDVVDPECISQDFYQSGFSNYHNDIQCINFIRNMLVMSIQPRWRIAIPFSLCFVSFGGLASFHS